MLLSCMVAMGVWDKAGIAPSLSTVLGWLTLLLYDVAYSPRPEATSAWSPPPVGIYKCNIDAIPLDRQTIHFVMVVWNKHGVLYKLYRASSSLLVMLALLKSCLFRKPFHGLKTRAWTILLWKPIVGKLCLPFVQTMKASRNSALWLMIVECCKLHFNMTVSLGSRESLIRLLISWVG
ncbi:hypothetical protein J1N35_026459 [Gossypium stocksii]|uniref:Uncharacterized protein n=1 Tax=Gossypium stocksii TaxID=47602 RepID=A0A9D3ZYN3_9ROSI|nr:hypothetical protein J1N35_026459 [Gossypium stocksii]